MRKSMNNGGSKGTPARKPVRRTGSRSDLQPQGEKLLLERVLGLTTNNTSGLSCNPVTGAIAYLAGCVVVLLDPKTSKQSHIISPDKRTVTCLALSSDGRYLAVGETGQNPSLRVWELNEAPNLVAELQGHKSGITSVEFSPNQKYLVSIGDQHDMLVNVWHWRSSLLVATNKSGCRVRAISFSQTGDYLVTAGNRHVKFWYLEVEAPSKASSNTTVPINGRSGILGEQRNNCFCDVKCGKGQNALLTYCVTKAGLLCLFNEKRILDKWVDLKAGSTNCLAVNDKFVFCGCADGLIRVFGPTNLQYIATLPRPHYLGVNVSEAVNPSALAIDASNKRYPDLVAMTLDEGSVQLSCIYNDHSLYVWDVHDIHVVGKCASFLFHSACIWGVETYPYFEDDVEPCLPPGSFLTCASDDTIRVWNIDHDRPISSKAYPRNLYSKELLKVVYIDESFANLPDVSFMPFSKDAEGRNGVRCMQISPDGQVLATGDRSGNLRIYDLQFFEEIIRIDAHEAEVLCVEFSKPESGFKLLASSSKDRLIHIFDLTKDFGLLQTIDDHSSSITAVKFHYHVGILQLLSCGADKLVMFHTGQRVDSSDSIHFVRNTVVSGKATLYDMAVDPIKNYAASVGQDRNVRTYDIQGYRQVNCYKGSQGEEGNLIKIQLDSSGMYAAVSCSDKTIGVYEFESGYCESVVQGHSELATGLNFAVDGRRLISVSGDGCIFVWKLPLGIQENIVSRLTDIGMPFPKLPLSAEEESRRKAVVAEKVVAAETPPTPARVAKPSLSYRFSVGKLPSWAQKKMGANKDPGSSAVNAYMPRAGRWAEQVNDPSKSRSVTEFEKRLAKTRLATSDVEESLVGTVIFPSPKDLATADPDRSFLVTEASQTFHHHSVEKLSEKVSIESPVTEEDADAAGEDMEGDSSGDSSVQSSDPDDLMSPVLDAFEKLSSPAVRELMSKPLSTSALANGVGEHVNTRTHRASISAKFYSRSERVARVATSSLTSVSSFNSATSAGSESREHGESSKSTLSRDPSNLPTNQRIRRQRSAASPQPKPKLSEPTLSSSSTSDRSRGRLQSYPPPMHTPLRRATPPSDTRPRAKSDARPRKAGVGVCAVEAPSPFRRTEDSDEFSASAKNKSLSRSCQNISVTQEADRTRLHSLGLNASFDGVFSEYDRRHSTPLRKDPPTKEATARERTQKRNFQLPGESKSQVCPVTSPVANRSNSVENPSPSASSKTVASKASGKAGKMTSQLSYPGVHQTAVSPTASSWTRPQSLFLEGCQFASIDEFVHENVKQVMESQLPTSGASAVGNLSKKVSSGRQSPVSLAYRAIEVDQKTTPASAVDNDVVKTSLLASEIEANMASMSTARTRDSLRRQSGLDFDESKRLILMYESGLVANGRSNVVQGSPPERDVPNFEIAVERPSTGGSVPIAPPALVDIAPDEVTWDSCHSVMCNLVRAYGEARQMHLKVLQQQPSNDQQKLLSLVSKTYTAIENNVSEELHKINKSLDCSERHPEVVDSSLFREIRQSLDSNLKANDDFDKQAPTERMLTLLEKYSSLLVDVISSKLKESAAKMTEV